MNGFFSKSYFNHIINLGYHVFLNCLSSIESWVFHCLKTINYEIYIFLDHKEFHIDKGKHHDVLVFKIYI